MSCTWTLETGCLKKTSPPQSAVSSEEVVVDLQRNRFRINTKEIHNKRLKFLTRRVDIGLREPRVHGIPAGPWSWVDYQYRKCSGYKFNSVPKRFSKISPMNEGTDYVVNLATSNKTEASIAPGLAVAPDHQTGESRNAQQERKDEKDTTHKHKLGQYPRQKPSVRRLNLTNQVNSPPNSDSTNTMEPGMLR